MAATWDTIDRYVVISTDTHAGADLYDYKKYLPARLRDDFDAWAKTYVSPFDDLIIATAKRNWDHDLRMSEMDADGVAAEVLLPNTVPPFFPTTPNITISLPRTRQEFEQRWAGVQAHNRWQVDFCCAGAGPAPRTHPDLSQRHRPGSRRDSLGCRAEVLRRRAAARSLTRRPERRPALSHPL